MSDPVFDEQSAAERTKYVRAYTETKYKRNAGRQAFKNADYIENLALRLDAHSVWDFGCGNGDFMAHMADMGLYAYMTDFMGPEYLSGPVIRLIREGRAQFFHNSLWDPELPSVRGDLGVCTDVMEHIPEDRVDEVLAAIAARVPVCFFRIAMTECSPRAIERRGGPLHVTVKPEDWWQERLNQHFNKLDDMSVWVHPNKPSKRILVLTAYK